MFAGAMGMASPSKAAEVIGGLLTDVPGTDDVLAQGLQAAANMAVIGSGELMDAAIRQHGGSPAVALSEMQINLQIEQQTETNHVRRKN